MVEPPSRPPRRRAEAGHDAEAIGHELGGPVWVEGISTGGSTAQQFALGHASRDRRLP